MPLRRFLPPSLKALAASDADFTSGDSARSLRVLGLPPFSPLICYEVVFSGKVIDPQDRPDLIINVTNDGWYGNTIGPYQHFAIARVRAIEEGLPLLRAANTGISGAIDPLGRIISMIPLNKQGVIDTILPLPLPLTSFGKSGDMPVLVVFLALVVYAFARRTTKF
jgi:apolipoprotein N-acyltransferase